MLQPVLDAIKADHKAADDRVAEYDTQVLMLETKLETLEENLKELKANHSAEANIEGLIGLLEGYINDAATLGLQAQAIRNEFETEKTKRTSLEQQLETAPNFAEDIAAAEGKIAAAQKERKKNRRAKEELALALEGAIECPKCHERFIPNAEFDLTPDQIRKIITQREADDVKLAAAVKKAEEALEALEDKQREYDQLQSELSRVKRSMVAIRERADRLKRQMDDVERRKNDLQKRIEEARRAANEDASIKTAEAKIKATKAELKTAKAELADFRYLAESMAFWDFHMGKNGFTTYLANKAIDALTGSANRFLEIMDMDFRLHITPFQTLKNGDARDKMEVFISSDGISTNGYATYSGGERQRVGIAALLGVQRLLNMSTDGRGLDMLLLDESLSGVDSLGTMSIVKTMKRLKTTILLITQNIEDPSFFDSVICVRKIDGVSTLV